MKFVKQSESTASRRRVYFHLVGIDGITPATGEAGGQPQISSDGAAWTNTGISTLTAVGSGRYYADLSSGSVASVGVQIESRYRSANTAECPGDSALIVAFDLFDAAALGLSNLDAAISSRSTLTDAGVWSYGSRLVHSANTVTGSVGSVASSVTVGTNNDKAGYTVSGGVLFSVGSVTGSVGSVVSPVTVGTNNDKSGYTVSTNQDKTGYSLTITPPTSGQIATAVWNESQSGHSTAGTFGKYLDQAISSISAATSGDWSPTEKQQIRDALGLTGTKTTSAGGVLQSLLTAALSVGSWTVISPVTEVGDFTVMLGYDYTNAVGRALSWSSDTWTNLASASSVALVDRDETIISSGTVVTGGTGTQTVRVELTQAQIANLGAGQHRLRLKAVISGLDYLLLDLTGTVSNP